MRGIILLRMSRPLAPPRRRSLASLVLPLAAAFAIALVAGGRPAEAAPAAPSFTLDLLDGGGRFDSRSRIGKKVLVVRFQATWCRPCVNEQPALQDLWERYRSRGVEIVAVHVQDDPQDTAEFLRDHGVTHPAGLDPKFRIANRFKANKPPYTVVINRRGEIVARLAGAGAVAKLPRILEPLLETKPRKKPPEPLR